MPRDRRGLTISPLAPQSRPLFPRQVLRLALLGVCALALCATLGGCGYVMTSSLDDMPERSVELTTVENQLFPPRPGLEYDLTRRIKDEIALDRRLRLVSEGGDVRVRVSLVRFEEPTIVKDLKTAAPSEILLRATAVVEARGYMVPGGSLRRRVTATDGYAPSLGESREEALARLWRDLSRQILDAATDREWAASGAK